MSFEVKIEQYAGPLQLLLELIEKEKLPITDISLAQVTDDYLKYMVAHEPIPEELADFLVIATRLLLIKSHAILPREELLEEEGQTTLAAQLALYKIFVEAANILDKTQQKNHYAFERAVPDVVKTTGFALPQGLTSSMLSEAFARLLKYLEPFFKLQQAAIERIVSVKERLAQIQEAMLTRSRMTFKEMVGQGKSKVDIVVSFLALLELVKQRTVQVVQSKPFAEIELKRVD